MAQQVLQVLANLGLPVEKTGVLLRNCYSHIHVNKSECHSRENIFIVKVYMVRVISKGKLYKTNCLNAFKVFIL